MVVYADAQPSPPSPSPDPAPPPTPADPRAQTPAPTPAPDPATTASDPAAPPVPSVPATPPPAHVPSAADETIDPSQLPPPEPAPPPPPYPRALVKRPLVFPAGRGEVSIGVGLGHETLGEYGLMYGAIGFSGRFASRLLEPYASIQLVPLYSADVPSDVEIDIPFLHRISVGTRLRIADDLAVGVRASAADLGTNHDGYSPGVYIQTKLRPSDEGAVALAAGVEYSRLNVLTGYNSSGVSEQVSAFASAAAQLQVTPVVALEVSGSIALHRRLEQYVTDPFYRSYSYGGAMLISVSDAVDIVPSFGVLSSGDLGAVVGAFSVALH
jgi:hypothetical protein